jgi:RimJ/RimL family protein N-acetyltransferase
MIKDIVLNLGLGSNDPAVDYAVSMAEILEAHLLAIAVSYDPIIPGTVMGGIPPEIIEGQRHESDKKARAAIARFEQAAKRAGISSETRTINASLAGAADQIGRIGRRFDLIIVGQPNRQKSSADEVVDEGVLFESGRPVIFVPFIQKGAAKLERMMICWDGGRAATRAVADSLPLLKKAKQVEVVIISDKPRSTRRRSWPASCPTWSQGGRQTHHVARHRRALHHPLSRGGFLRRHDRHGWLWPFASARIRAWGRHAWSLGIDDGSRIDVALTTPSSRGAVAAVLERHITLHDGEKVLIRPLKPEDAALYPDFLREITADDLRLRFFVPMREVRHELIEKLTHYDPKHAMAFVAIAESTNRMLGVVRLHDDREGDGAEFAILVRSHLKGHGLGWLMMKHMIAYAQEKGLKTVHGQVLTENATMLLMCTELGFHVSDDAGERGMKVVTLPLDELPALN